MMVSRVKSTGWFVHGHAYPPPVVVGRGGPYVVLNTP
jgi:hypothetical protein